MENFRVFRAIGLSFTGWFANFIPITLLAAVIYAPVVVWAITLPGPEALATGNPEVLVQDYLTFFTRGVYLLVGLGTLLAPLITYRVVQHMNGRKVPLLTSVKYGFRGIIPAVILAIATNVLAFIPVGGIIAIIVTCYWFVAAPAAVAEKLGPGGALTRSAHLTAGRRGGIFGLNLLVGLTPVIYIYGVFQPAIESAVETGDLPHLFSTLKQHSLIVVGTVCVFQLFVGITQAVSYSLLRTDKDGVSNEELAAVFD